MSPNRLQQPLLAHYTTTLGISLLTVGAIALLVSVGMAMQSQGSFLLVIFGLLFLFLGVYSLNRPYFLLEPRQLTVYNLLGMKKKHYTFESWEFVKADNRRIYIDDNGITKKVPVAPWLVNTEDWRTMRNLL